ncbi:MAG TPA: NAD(P)H-hydrate dehydratase [Acidimicrobiales bacterium]|nr:NAD(P)H-hydrate dehydratase [Acidimicrobiales bacterium]
MIPVVTVAQMRASDAAATDPIDTLIERSGAAVARAAMRMLGGGYGRRVAVVVGPGKNGADGAVAAVRLRRRGVGVDIVAAAAAPERLAGYDLVIDAAFGTGFRGEYRAPDPGGTPVLAVDIPSGVHGDTGEAADSAVRADATVVLAALKPGVLFGEGRERAGAVEVADIGLAIGEPSALVVETADVHCHVPRRSPETHKWAAGVYVVAGSAGMYGAADLCARAALRAGASTVRLAIPGASPGDLPISEAIGVALPGEGWADEVLEQAPRFKALVIGPGLGRSDATAADVRRVVAGADIPVLVDADALHALGKAHDAVGVISARSVATVLTPHDGEFERLAGTAPGPDRLGAAGRLASETGAIVLSKGSTTVVAEKGRPALISTSGSSRLATAGTGDVLAGVIGAFLAMGVEPQLAAALGAHVHGEAARLGPAWGLLAGDLVDLVPQFLAGALADPR